MTDIEKLMRQMEFKKKTMELEDRFQRNVRLLQRLAPDVYQEYANYKPEKIKLTLTQEGYINLVNADLDNKPVYPEDPNTYTQNYIKQYRELPTDAPLTLFPRENVLDIENDAHMKHNNDILRRIRDSRGTPEKRPLPEKPKLMIVLGAGLGYHLEMLLREHEIQHLILIEPNKDIFHASLHTCEWERIFNRFSGQDRSMQMILGRSPTETIRLLQQHIHRIGAFNAINSYVFPHLSSKEHEKALKEGLRGITKTISTLGYFDDERIGLAHTIENVRKGPPILSEHISMGTTPVKTRAFIVANGPSLDHATDFLKSAKNSGLIISCGTALGSLAKIGVKPHIHIEMERTRPVVEWIENSTSQDFRNGIHLVALNTVHPDVFKLFEKRHVILKPNDLGTSYIKQFIKAGEHVIQLPHCNPTVANAAASFAAALGIPEVYLFGLDLGFSSGEQHHSSLSKHYDIKEEHIEALNLYQHDAQGNTTAEANFGGTITTNGVYMNAKLSLEQLISESPTSRFCNTSNGLLIEGARPTPVEKIPDAEPAETDLILNEIFRRYFSTSSLTKIPSKQETVSAFQPAVKILDNLAETLHTSYTSVEECHKVVENQHQLYRKQVERGGMDVIDTMLKGSIENFAASLEMALHTHLGEKETVELFNRCVGSYLAFLNEAKRKIRSGLLNLDRRSRDISQKSLKN